MVFIFEINFQLIYKSCVVKFDFTYLPLGLWFPHKAETVSALKLYKRHVDCITQLYISVIYFTFFNSKYYHIRKQLSSFC